MKEHEGEEIILNTKTIPLPVLHFYLFLRCVSLLCKCRKERQKTLHHRLSGYQALNHANAPLPHSGSSAKKKISCFLMVIER